MEAPGQLPSLPSPKSGAAKRNILVDNTPSRATINYK